MLPFDFFELGQQEHVPAIFHFYLVLEFLGNILDVELVDYIVVLDLPLHSVELLLLFLLEELVLHLVLALVDFAIHVLVLLEP